MKDLKTPLKRLSTDFAELRWDLRVWVFFNLKMQTILILIPPLPHIQKYLLLGT